MPPLFVFKLDESTGHVERVQIDEYHHENKGWSSNQPQYVFMMRHGRTPYQYRVKEEHIDKFVSGKVVSFEDNKEKAVETIKAYFRERVVTARREVRKFEKLIAQID